MQETPLLSATILDDETNYLDTHDNDRDKDDGQDKIFIKTDETSDIIELKLSCIEEERFNCGIGDPVEVIFDNTDEQSSILQLQVIKVVNPQTIIVSPFSSSSASQSKVYDVIEMILKGSASLKNVKKSLTVQHS